jgi:hypothetical protein
MSTTRVTIGKDLKHAYSDDLSLSCTSLSFALHRDQCTVLELLPPYGIEFMFTDLLSTLWIDGSVLHHLPSDGQ